MVIQGKLMCLEHPDVESKYSEEKQGRVCGECEELLTPKFLSKEMEDKYDEFLKTGKEAITKYSKNNDVTIIEKKPTDITKLKRFKLNKELGDELSDKVVSILKDDGIGDINNIYRVLTYTCRRIKKQEFGEYAKRRKKKENE